MIFSENRFPLFRIMLLILPVGGELLFQRREFREWRIGIDGTVAVTRRSARRIGPVRGAALALVAPAFVTAMIASATLAIIAIALPLAAEFVATALVVAVPALALETLARAIALLAVFAVLSVFVRRSARRRRRSGLDGGAFAGLAEVFVAVVPAMPVTIALVALARFARCCRRGLRAVLGRLRMAMAVAIMMMARPAVIRPAAGSPDLDELRLGCWRRRGVRRCRLHQGAFCCAGFS